MGGLPNCTTLLLQYALFFLCFTCNLWHADYHINKLCYFLSWSGAKVAPKIRYVAAEKHVRSSKAGVVLWHGIKTWGQKTEILPVVGWPWLDARCPPSRSITPLLRRTRGWENKMEKNLVGEDKGSLIKQKQRPRVEAKENRRFILSFPSAGDVQPLPGKQGFSTRSGCSGRQT